MKSHKVKTLKELFVKDLARIHGGDGAATSTSSTETQSTAPQVSTTQACCEEKNDPCC
ncbi:hypothetical protein HUA74_22780 [Myxococcus sp. CA051A]|uniref:hypothetical protein n=1 Tax=Myxococcus TaxID=32 RepID=UPI00157AAD4A|nr:MULTISPECIES: hypothetical protein [Myxococcus]NTX08870.1 hypothetical protein [Myxococcus sp. CA040A]NTX17665.1 hypothetical protein [Myxococcus sp. CA056]NTX40786.1 hypothetical protein [Myxococcus sp. CA033]NTX56211.1 hypothetical protein [Myxococcus sp. CA039A]NTX63482.1 hypothetical protein [Myxococcus sp. CA051A]